ncbi:MAG: S8 family peptidase [Elusimicrobiota bacterium]|jgi:subtilisin/minor extracellular protease Epr
MVLQHGSETLTRGEGKAFGAGATSAPGGNVMRLIATAIIILLGAAFNAEAAGKRYLVGFTSGVSAMERGQKLAALGVRTLETIRTQTNSSQEFEAYLVEGPEGLSAKKASPARSSFRMDVFGGSEAPAADDGMIVEEDVTLKWIESAPASFQAVPFPNMAAVMGSLPKFTPVAQVKGELPWGVKRVRAHAAWDVTEGKGVKVAVIDTGIKDDHPDLNGQVVGGYNAITQSDAEGAWMDDNGHGTHVAGTIAAKKDGKGVVGVAPQAKLYGVKVLDAAGSGSLSSIVRGIVWAVNNNMQVANMSLGASMGSDLMHRAVQFAAGRGMVIVAAAGNSGGSVGFPGAYEETICVAASDSDDKLAGFSSRGPEVDFIAPGHYIVSTWPNNNTVSLSGTSMAAPHVTGLAAIAIAQGARGIGGPDGVMAAFKKASKSIGLQKEHEGYGMIDGAKLVE